MLDKYHNYIYNEVISEINLEEGDTCDPDLYAVGKNIFIQMSEKVNMLEEISALLSLEEIQVHKQSEKIYVFRISFDNKKESSTVELTYDLNHPLRMNPTTEGVSYKYYDLRALDLTKLPLCSVDGFCSEDQDFSFLINM